MELRQLSALLAVAEHGSFSAAARAMHTVQSNVSTHVAHLERELAVTLVDRGSGTLTEEGEAAVARARRIRLELDGLASDLAALRDEVIGHVRIGMIGSVGRWLVPRVLSELQLQHPGVDLVIIDATTTSLLPQVLDGSLDIAVVNIPVADPDVAVEPLFEEERILVVPHDHALARWAGRSEPVPIETLAEHRMVMEPRGTAFRDELDADATRYGVRFEPLAEVDGMTLVASLAFGEFGPAVLPATAALGDVVGSAVRLHVDGLARRGVGLARRRRDRLTVPARAVRDLLIEAIEGEATLQDGVFLSFD